MNATSVTPFEFFAESLLTSPLAFRTVFLPPFGIKLLGQGREGLGLAEIGVLCYLPVFLGTFQCFSFYL